MLKGKHLCWLIAWTLIGCGPQTIFVRPGLDTPSQHVSNGYVLLDRGKFNDACREFERARELDPRFTEAYVGLGIAYAHKGDIDKGLKILDRAKAMAVSDEERDSVQKGYARIDQIINSREHPQ